GRKLVEQASGILIFPRVYKFGFAVGAEYGEGALRVNGKSVDYYSMTSGSFGFQFGADQKQIVILFMNNEVFEQLRKGSGWKAGVDASVTMGRVGDGASIDTRGKGSLGPILAFIIDRRGLMYDLTLEGTKFEKWSK
ncbi:MAG: lipid-binding SYLF domain-containing protein, partial [Candidatus Wallbacteria bacterium]|nr:lipid-binding SYLF domain-containing protein [Candidatus Wallbacteria bacterium]